MDEKLLKQIVVDLAKLTKKVDSIESSISQVSREVGAATGKMMFNQIDNLEAGLANIKAELDKIRVDTNSIRKVQEYGSRDMQDVKKALAAIYRNTDELETHIVPEDQRLTK